MKKQLKNTVLACLILLTLLAQVPVAQAAAPAAPQPAALPSSRFTVPAAPKPAAPAVQSPAPVELPAPAPVEMPQLAPATWTINSTNDVVDTTCNVTHCSLREAIQFSTAGDLIVFDSSLSGQTITVTGLISANKSFNIDGSTLENRVRITTNNLKNLFNFYGATTVINITDVELYRAGQSLGINQATVTLTDVLISNGSSGIYNDTGNLTLLRTQMVANGGGGIYSRGPLSITDSAFINNTGTDSGALNLTFWAAATITGTTFSGNSSTSGHGTAISNFTNNGEVVISNSTFSGQTSPTESYTVDNDGKMTLRNVTIANNVGVGLINWPAGTLHLTNSIITSNAGWTDCSNSGTLGSSTNNIIRKNGFEGDGLCGTASDVDPMLEPLADNGGDSKTHALNPDSPAIDAGDPATCTATDQRGILRPKDGNLDGSAVCDIGAFEFVSEMDYGDLPGPYLTMREENGARHYFSEGFYMGSSVDIDTNGFHSDAADGDDNDPFGGTDDEDGVTFLSVLRTNETVQAQVVLSGSGYLYAWMDFNHDGDWIDTGEKVINGVYKTAGTHSFPVLVPANASLGQTAARFRFSSRARLQPDGIGVDGEVEDYLVTIERGRPVANPDMGSLDENRSVLLDVLPNDKDYYGTISLTGVATNPVNGTAVLDAGTIRYTPNADYSGADTFSYTITNDIGLTQKGIVTILVRNVNTAPKDIQITDQQTLTAVCTASDICTLPAGTLVGLVRAVDPDLGDTHTFNLVDSPQFRLSGTSLYTNTAISFTGNTNSAQATAKVKATDAGNLSFEKTFSISVLGDKMAGGPEKITLSASKVSENNPAGTVVGDLNTTEATAYPPYNYQFVSGAGSSDNGNFQIVSGQLQTAKSLNFEQKPLNRVRIRTTNSRGQSKEEMFTIQLVDDPNEPTQPPPNCSGATIDLINTGTVQMRILNPVISNVSDNGCGIKGQLSLAIPGWSGSGIAFEGKVDARNDVTAHPRKIGQIDLLVGGVPLKVKEPALETYDGKIGLRLNQATFCLPKEWGGLCAPATGVQQIGKMGIGNDVAVGGGMSMLIDDGGLKISESFDIGFPSIIISNQLSLKGLTGAISAVPGGYEFKLGGEFGLPQFNPGGASDCGITAAVTIYTDALGELAMDIQTQPPSIQTVSLHEITVGLSCDQGIAIGNSGLALTGVEGTVALRADSQNIKLSMTVSTIKKIPVLDIAPVKATGEATLQWSPDWGLSLGATITLLDTFNVAKTEMAISDSKFTFTANVEAWLVYGELTVNAWTDWSRLHMTGEGEVEVGFRQGKISSTCGCVPYPTDICYKWGAIPYPCGWEETCGCLDIPPFDLYLTMNAEFGEFKNGAWGFKGYVTVPIIGNIGVYIDSEPSLSVTGLDQYQLVTAPEIISGVQAWRERHLFGQEAIGPDLFEPNAKILVKNDHQVVLRAQVNIQPAGNSTQATDTQPYELDTEKTTLFALSASEPLEMSLQAPDGTLITPTNYNNLPGYQVEYTEEFYYQSNTPRTAATADMPRVRVVLAATHANWAEVNVSLDGAPLLMNLRLDDPNPAAYFSIEPGQHTLSVVPSAGGSAVQAIFTAEFKQDYTFLAYGPGAQASTVVLTDDNVAPSAQNKVRVRFVHTVAAANPVDIYVGGVLVQDDATSFSAGSYFEIDPGESSVQFIDAVTSLPLGPEQAAKFTAGGVYTLVDAQMSSQYFWSQFLDEAYIPRTNTTYKVVKAANGTWNVILDGNLDSSLPMVSVTGIDNPPSLILEQANTQDPFHPSWTYRATSDYLPATVSIFANPGAYVSEGQPVYQGIKLAEVNLDTVAALSGSPQTYTASLSIFETGSYSLWMRIEDGVNPPISAYLSDLSGTPVVVPIDQSTTFPTTWAPTITHQVNTADRSLELEWQGLNHPDVDNYTVYMNTQPHHPVVFVEGLSTYRETDANGNPFGPALGNTSISNVEPGMIYYYSVEAVDTATGKTVRSPEASVTVPTGDFALDTFGTYALAQAGETFRFPIAMNELEPLFYPFIGMSIDTSLAAPGMRVWFDDAQGADTYLSPAKSMIWVNVELSDTTPDGGYAITFNGDNRSLRHSATVYILVNVLPTDLSMTGSYHVSGEDVQFTFTVINIGSQNAQDARVMIPLPEEFNDVTWNCIGVGAVCGSGTGSVNETISNFPPGAVLTYTVQGTILISESFEVTGVVEMWPGGDLDLSDNQVTLLRTFTYLPQLLITKKFID
jgi:CSLREA domain-containing protein